MIGVINSVYLALRLYLWRRREMHNVTMRNYFREHYGVDVGMYSYGCFDRWRMPGPLRVGRYCSIASTARSTNNNHWVNALTTHPALYDQSCGGVVDQDHVWDGHLSIEDDVWIGHNVMILAGCRKIGRGAVIGAGSIVTRDVEPYAVMVGNPARKLRDRFPPELAAAIDATRWWELDMAELRHLVQTDRELVFHPDLVTVERWLTERVQNRVSQKMAYGLASTRAVSRIKPVAKAKECG